ncbi:DUF1294 domain-containing protein [Sedimentibacter sp. MB31-C6]|uniref:DUF1294 domain-containing protein n=1 Tax=Sedimentibacter sp. MB31-C6 TaxID=3109366 RepID=UPI002DDD5DC3|nr:DUF1294 domain-containing protein [Sedimentibacter sp. MB36-C1]WSI05075.1 DUF1294 domain-containing protein [Sedimentibacter sp. MB36-C1]
MDYIKYILMYLIFINVISFVLFYIDKWKAKKDRWRIKERTLHLTQFFGGSFGSIVAMFLFHHKTKKLKFVIITGVALIFNIFIIYQICSIGSGV